MVVIRNIELFLNGTDENTRNRHFRYIDFPDEPNHDDEDELLDELLEEELLDEELEDSHESGPENYEPVPENLREIDIHMDDCIGALVYVLTHEYPFDNDDDLRTVLMHAFNNEYPPECDDVLRGLIDDGKEVIDDAIEHIERYHFDINEVVDYAMYTVNEQRRHPEWVF